ncbi:MAG: hypothetical protein CMH50_05160 [Myxococcales bacterium]|nr:hypothetical protein [Myxococcales bacterium]
MAKDRNEQVESAAKLIQKGQFDKAVVIYEQLLAGDPSDYRTQHKLADLLARMGKVAESVQAYLRVAEYHTRLGFLPQAVAVYKQALRLDSSRPEVHERLGDLYLSLELMAEAVSSLTSAALGHQKAGDYDEAVGILKRLVEVAPQNLSGRLRYADALFKAGKKSESVAAFLEAAEWLWEQKRLTEFIRVAERVLSLDRRRHGIARRLAEAHLHQGQPRLTLKVLQGLFAADPTHTGTLRIMAKAFMDLEKPAKALQVLRECGRLLVQAGDPTAQEVFQQILELAPGDRQAIDALNLRPENTDERPALRTSPEPMEPVPHEATGLFRRNEVTQVNRLVAEADSFLKLHLYSQARDCMIRAVQGRPTDVLLREQLYEIYLQLDDKSGAVRQLLTMISEAHAQGLSLLEKRYREILVSLGESVVTQAGIQDEGEDLEDLLQKATNELEKDDDFNFSMTMDPVQAIISDADRAFAQGLAQQAKSLIEDGLTLYPDNEKLLQKRRDLGQRGGSDDRAGQRVPALPSGVPSHLDPIRTMINNGSPDQAIEALRELVEKVAPGQTAAHYLAAIALLEMKQASRGIAFLKRAMHGEDIQEELRTMILYELGQAYGEIGDHDEAVYYLKKVKHATPEYRRVEELLKRSETAKENESSP